MAGHTGCGRYHPLLSCAADSKTGRVRQERTVGVLGRGSAATMTPARLSVFCRMIGVAMPCRSRPRPSPSDQPMLCMSFMATLPLPPPPPPGAPRMSAVRLPICGGASAAAASSAALACEASMFCERRRTDTG